MKYTDTRRTARRIPTPTSRFQLLYLSFKYPQWESRLRKKYARRLKRRKQARLGRRSRGLTKSIPNKEA